MAGRGNPMTGPFYVEGAQPGDTLAVRLESMVPSRDWGWTSSVLAPNVVDPIAARALPPLEIVRWSVDAEQALVVLENPTSGLAGLKFEARPFLGCFGVAPPKDQAISTATSGEYGGNMDYKGLVAGVTIYLPVFVEGALFHLGDGHAVQGCGEIVGTGLERNIARCPFHCSGIEGENDRLAPRRIGHALVFASATPGRLSKRCSMQRQKCWLY